MGHDCNIVTHRICHSRLRSSYVTAGPRLTDSRLVFALQLEEIINIEALDRLKDAFSRADKDGQRKLTETQFQGVLREALGMRNQQEDQVRVFVYERAVMHVRVKANRNQISRNSLRG